MSKEILAVASDIDGTLLGYALGEDRHDPPPTPRVEGAMVRLEHEAIPKIGVTSRNQTLMEGDAVRRLRFGLSVIDGGATIYNATNGEVVNQNWLTKKRLLSVVRAIGSLCTEIYCDTNGSVRTSDNLRLDDIHDAPSVFAIFESQRTNEIEERLSQLGNLAFKFNAMDGSNTEACVQVTDETATKEAALTEVCRELNVPLESVLALGDGPGDKGFLSMAGISGVMGNGDMDLFRIPNRVILPSVRNDGAAIGIEQFILNEPGSIRRKTKETWRDGQRPPMSIKARDTVLNTLLQNNSLVQNPKELNDYVASLYSFAPLNPWEGADRLKRCLIPAAQQLYSADLDLLRPCSGEAHANAVRNLLEEHFAEYLRHSPVALATMRLYTELQDSGKPLSIAITGDNKAQDKYNPLVNDNILQSLNGKDAAIIQQAIHLLSKYDLLGVLLKAKSKELRKTTKRLADGPLAELRAAWPESIGVSADDMLLISYLCDAGAHTRFATQPDELSSEFDLKWAVTPEDSQLTDLFEHSNDSLLLLQPKQRKKVARLLTNTQATTPLLALHDGEDNSTESHAASFTITVQYFFDRLRKQSSDQLEDTDSGVSATIENASSSSKWSWAEKLILREAPKEMTIKPSRVPGASIVLQGRLPNGFRQDTYYVRGGKIWHQKHETHFGESGPISDTLNLLETLNARDEVHQYSGPELAAEVDVRTHFGKPLSDTEAEEFMDLLYGNQ